MNIIVSTIILTSCLSSQIVFAAKPGSNTTSPQDVNVVNEVKLDPAQTFQMLVTDPESRIVWVGYAGIPSSSLGYILFRGTEACRAAFTNGRVSGAREIRIAIHEGYFELPAGTSYFLPESGIPWNNYYQSIDQNGLISSTYSQSTSRVACSAPSR